MANNGVSALELGLGMGDMNQQQRQDETEEERRRRKLLRGQAPGAGATGGPPLDLGFGRQGPLRV